MAMQYLYYLCYSLIPAEENYCYFFRSGIVVDLNPVMYCKPVQHYTGNFLLPYIFI